MFGLKEDEDMLSLLWIQAGACSGDSMALLSAESPDLLQALEALHIEILWHPSLSTVSLAFVAEPILAGERPLNILVIEGAILTGPDGTGMFDTFQGKPRKDFVLNLCEQADVIVAVGTCAAFGGIPAAHPNPTDAVGMQFLREELEGGLLEAGWRSKKGLPVINLSGCPVHPNTVLQTLAFVATGAKLELDHLHRPAEFYETLVHQGCTRNEYHEYDVEETRLGTAGCMFFNLGCQGPRTIATCNAILWNGQSSKTRAGVPCFGCTSPSFPRPEDLFVTEKLGSVPTRLPLGVDRAAYMSYKGLAAAAVPLRLTNRKTKF
ncbi:MAG TPA: NADH:ubiquinone oxidoreductase [Pseudomonadota bacterium]|nr:NADH:ubiquinone oxidoreductase [Pseudomonadota bacterium]